ncbi:hypothetical protein LJR220_005691 [Bradyrhizobium sp. LjRoot220]|uniref:hypothetical protein n=1 Tax=Bradyrhizobium sp. LjRoot220 TaxID=3342284 RepID=UPI003ECD0D10
MLRHSVRILTAAACVALLGAFTAAAVTGAFAQASAMQPTGAKPTSRPSDSGIIETRRDGEAIEDRVERLEKEAEAALNNCDEAAFWAARRALIEEVVHVVKRLRVYGDPASAAYQRELRSEWSRYLVDIAFWQYIRPPDCLRTAPGQAQLVPLPEQPALQPRSYGTTGDWKFVIGEVCSANPELAACTQSNTPSVNLAADSGTSCTYTSSLPSRLPLIPINDGGPSISPQTPASGTPSSPPPGAAASADASPPPGEPVLGPGQAERLADIFFPSKSGRPRPAGPTVLPPGSSPPPSGPGTSLDPSTWTPGPPGGIPPDAAQADGTDVSPELVEWLKNELDQLIEKNRQRQAGQDNSARPGSAPPAPAASASTSSAPTSSDAPPAAADKPATTAEPAGTPTWIGPVPKSPFTTKLTSQSDTLPAGTPPASTDAPPPSTSPPPASTSTPPASTSQSSAPSTPIPVAGAPTPDAPREIQVTIHFKLNVANLPQAEVPKTAEGHIAGLLVDAPPLPGKPGTSASQTAQTIGAGQDALRCRAGADGSCTVSQKPGGVTGPGTAAGSYRIDVPVSQTAGGIIETTGSKTEPNLTGPPGLNVIGQAFAVGPRTFMRVGFAQAFGLSVDPQAFFQARFGDKYKIDFCFDEAPMGAHGIASSMLNSELPAAAIELRLSHRPRSSK